MINFLKKYWIVILIVVVAGFLRFYKLDTYPALNADEAAIGYNAYSLILTGHDEHGNSWPIHFQSFNDYKPGLYFYIVLPFVKLIGLNEWAVRIPGATFGVLSVLMVFLLVKELFKNEKFAIISTLFLAISPWHIQFSRGGWEVNTATFFLLCGLYFFFKSFKENIFSKNVVNIVVSSVFFVASLYTYHAARVIVPLIGLSLVLIYKDRVFKNFKPYILFTVLSVFLLIPLVKDLTSPGALSRVAGVGLFADPGPRNRINEQRGEHGNVSNIVGKLMHNKAVNYGLAFAQNWTSHFHGEFLFLSGDSIQRNKVPETGEMYLFDILFLLVGLVMVARNWSKEWNFVTVWLVLAPIASSLTFQAPNALRSQNMAIPLVIISAYGLAGIVDQFDKNKKLKRIGTVLLAVLILWNFARYQHMYWNHMSKEYPYSSQYGVKELVSYVQANGAKYKNVVVTDRYDQPYILFLFYSKYNPADFQGHHELSPRDQYGFSTVRSFDKYHFDSVNFDKIRTTFPNSLIIGTPGEIPKEANVVKRIYGTNGFEYFDVVAN